VEVLVSRARQEGRGEPQGEGSGGVGVGVRVWLEAGGEPVFGPGMLRLLVLTSQLGSLNKAAGKLNMSYSKAQRMLHKAEDRLGLALLERRIGGVAGGGSALTPDGERVVSEFVAMRREAYESIQTLFRRHFGDETFVAEGAFVVDDDA
jgi:molybdate transport system regulatory protein